MERIHASAYAGIININAYLMKSLNAKVTVANISLYSNNEGRQFISLILNEQIPARRLDKTGEFVVGYDNTIKMSLRQFMHIVFAETATMAQYYLSDKERSYYKTMLQSEYYNLFIGATLDIIIERFEDGESFINEIDSNEMTSDGVTFHTTIKDITLSDFSNDFAFGNPKDMAKMIDIINAAKEAHGKKFSF